MGDCVESIVQQSTKSMTTVIIQFPLPPGAPREAVKSGFLEVAPFSRLPPDCSESISYFRMTVQSVAASIFGPRGKRPTIFPKALSAR